MAMVIAASTQQLPTIHETNFKLSFPDKSTCTQDFLKCKIRVRPRFESCSDEQLDTFSSKWDDLRKIVLRPEIEAHGALLRICYLHDCDLTVEVFTCCTVRLREMETP